MEKAKKSDSLMTQMGLTSDEQSKIKSFVGFTQEDALALKDLLPLITEQADYIVDRFFENIKRYPELMDLIDRVGSSIDRLKVSQKKYFLTMFEGEYGENYFETRLKIGAMHTKIGLTPRWYLGSYSIYLQAITPLIMHKYMLSTTKRNRALFALYKIIMIDSELVIETYNQKSWDAETRDYVGQMDAINRSLAVIEFNMDGTIIKANPNFLAVMGYSLDEIVGKHHQIFVDASEANSKEYQQFWEKLRRGEYHSGEYKRIKKGGKEVWLESSYNPILDDTGTPIKVVKFASDITDKKLKAADASGQLDAVSKSQAVIEFDLDGTILDANDNFLNVMGYTLDEVKGQHHRIFVDANYAKTPEYIAFWEKLGRGEYDAGVYERIGKGGKKVWIQSSYNPIFDLNGKAYKVVKYATDITEQKNKDMRYKEQVSIFSGLMERVAKGDLRERVEITGDDELVMLGQSLNAMIESLSSMARQITEASDSMFKMLDELLAATSSQSSGASEQAAAVNETTSTLEEIKVASTQTLTKTQQLAEIAERTRKEGEDGIATVDEAVKGIESVREQMENIAQTILALSEQTQQIGEITSVVTNLAQQSKMLALNASIEAAKAGEAGKGFSVVASEVKELAEQSQQSTAQVQKILQDIRHATDRAVMATEEGRKDVDSGVILVQKSGEMMKQLGAVIHEAGTANQQIIVAVRQEVAGIEQTNAAMAEINKVINHFVNSTQQTKTATTELSSVAEQLKSLVAVYQLAQGDK